MQTIEGKKIEVLVVGHSYKLPDFQCPTNEGHQILNFIQKVPKETGSTELKTVMYGTTNEDVLKVLIDRLNYLQSQFPCRENAIALTKLDEALLWLSKRTEDRKNRGVEGQQKA